MKDGVISVSEITNSIKLLLENKIGLVSVEGEVSNYKAHYSGHRYFTLKDSNAQIDCTMWKSRELNFELKDGQKIVVTGNVTVYPARGSYQINVLFATPAGVGDLYQAFELLKQKLQLKGYFNPEHKHPLPMMPLHIGVSTSPTGAAVRDIFSTIKRRFPAATIYFRPTIVQGDSAAADIVNAIKELSRTPAEIIIIGRGGGSIEDLWCYNTEQVANAIYDCQIPIISGVGHETDFTIADFVADARAATPTAAAEIATSQTYFDLMNTINTLQTDMTLSINGKIENYRELVNDFTNKNIQNNVLSKIHYYYQLLDNKQDTIQRSVTHKIAMTKQFVIGLQQQLTALNPSSPLERGYAILKHNNKIINSKTSISQFKTIEVIRKDEKALVKVEQMLENDLFN